MRGGERENEEWERGRGGRESGREETETETGPRVGLPLVTHLLQHGLTLPKEFH